MLLRTLGASLLWNMLAAFAVTRAGYGSWEGREIIRARYGSKLNF